ncbi:hypothetical protein Gohar_010352 [Gossypium harknessii]|uniref:DUF4283 domain-containing protein n=1 Tax=Gossypium harknessii TaxID=34285 RepID=A0A7J9GSW4_9ROSI|nr:hypothetical protein [Gossypium harknessii]
MADLWHPLGGVIISDLGDKRYLFKFFYEVDIKRVIDGILWSFNRHLIIFHRLETGEYPKQIPLYHTYFHIQVQNFPHGIISEDLGTGRVFALLGKPLEPKRLFLAGTLHFEHPPKMFTSSKWLSEESSQGLQSSRNPTKMELDLRTQGNSIDEEEINMGGRRTNGTQ